VERPIEGECRQEDEAGQDGRARQIDERGGQEPEHERAGRSQARVLELIQH
jgi:hypothetical protein